MGIKADNVRLDANELQDWKGGIVNKLTSGVRSLLKMNGSELTMGAATITSPNTVEVVSAEGQRETYKAEKAIVVATGASTIEIPTFKFDGKQIIGAKEAVSLRQIPKHLLVIGGGIIGLELGMVYQKFGSKLTVLEALPQILTGVDPECAKVVERRITKHGGTIHVGAKALGYERQADGHARRRVQAEGRQARHGRVRRRARRGGHAPELEESRPRASSAWKINELRGFVPIDKFGRTNVPSIFAAIGDVSGPPPFAHKATKEGEIVPK